MRQQKANYKEYIPKAIWEVDGRIFSEKGEASKNIIGLVLALGAIHNDLRELGLYLEFSKLIPPGKDGELSPEKCQTFGTLVFIKKNLISVTHEFFVLIEKNKRTIESRYFKNLINNIENGAKEDWEVLVSIALNRNKRKSQSYQFSELLKNIRNCVGFHYYGINNFVTGLKLYIQSVNEKTVYLSSGKTTQDTRFYFSDVAVDKMIAQVLSEHGNSLEGITTITKKINNTINSIILQFLKLRNSEFELQE